MHLGGCARARVDSWCVCLCVCGVRASVRVCVRACVCVRQRERLETLMVYCCRR